MGISSFQESVETRAFQFNRNSPLRSGVWSSVLASWKLESIWREARYFAQSSLVVWRFFGSESGVFRIWPGVKMPKLFEASHRPWYQKARSYMLHEYFTRKDVSFC